MLIPFSNAYLYSNTDAPFLLVGLCVWWKTLKTLQVFFTQPKLSVPNDARWWIAPILMEQSESSVSIIVSKHFLPMPLLCWLGSSFCKGFVNCKSEITGDSFLLFENPTCLIMFQVCRNCWNVSHFTKRRMSCYNQYNWI